MLMNKLCFNKPLLLSLITAFIFLQWSATHIHLSGEHQHDGDHHQHTATAHQHQFANHHTDNLDPATDVLSHSDTNKVIELEQVCTQFHGKLAAQLAFIQPASWDIFEPHVLSSSLVSSYEFDSYQIYHQYTSIRLRAPPVIS